MRTRMPNVIISNTEKGTLYKSLKDLLSIQEDLVYFYNAIRKRCAWDGECVSFQDPVKCRDCELAYTFYNIFIKPYLKDS